MKTIELPTMTDDEIDMLKGLRGQMSDGAGENSDWCNKYWQNIVGFENKDGKSYFSFNESGAFANKTDEEIAKIVAVLDKHNFKHDTIVDSLTNKKLEHAYHRHDYTLGNKDSGLVYVLKMSNTPILERFEKGHASNWYSLIMASAHGEKMPLPYHKRYDNIDDLCNYIDEVLA